MSTAWPPFNLPNLFLFPIQKYFYVHKICDDIDCRFMESCGNELSCLYLANCKFVESDVLRLISEHCPKLSGIAQ